MTKDSIRLVHRKKKGKSKGFWYQEPKSFDEIGGNIMQLTVNCTNDELILKNAM